MNIETKDDGAEGMTYWNRLDEKHLKLWLDFAKFLLGSVVVALVTFMVDAGFKYREIAIKEQEYLAKFKEEALDDKIEVRIRLAEYFSKVTVTSEHRERWKAYLDLLVKKEGEVNKVNSRIAELTEKLESSNTNKNELTKDLLEQERNLARLSSDLRGVNSSARGNSQTRRRFVVVIDPGHGGIEKIGGSSSNNATSPHGILEKDLTLELARQVRKELLLLTSGLVDVRLTRDSDVNLGLSDRASQAALVSADIFVSLHFTAFNGSVRGTETMILSAANMNVNYEEDRALAERLQFAVVGFFQKHDSEARDRGVKDNQRIGTLNDSLLGNTSDYHPTRACLIEIEFIDHPKVDRLLNGPKSEPLKEELAKVIAQALIDDLKSRV